MMNFTLGACVKLDGPFPLLTNRGETTVGHQWTQEQADLMGSYEVHINVPLCAGPARVALAELARAGRFKLSDMDGHEHGEKRETILTAHGRDYEETQRRTHLMCRELQLAGHQLIRYKIEHVVIDSRVNDMWGLIHAPS